MVDELSNPLRHLNPTEQECVRWYVTLLCEDLHDNLREVHLFGSVARGDMWSVRFPIHSDIDVLVLVHEPLSPAVWEEIVNATYPLYLECGRQIVPQ